MTGLYTLHCSASNYRTPALPLADVLSMVRDERDCNGPHTVARSGESAEDETAELKDKLEQMRVIVAASVLKWELDPEFDRQYELEQLQAKLWKVVK